VILYEQQMDTTGTKHDQDDASLLEGLEPELHCGVTGLLDLQNLETPSCVTCALVEIELKHRFADMARDMAKESCSICLRV
jgi:hypothetical protein